MSDEFFNELFAVIEDRKASLPEDSYTSSLLSHDRGRNAILEKLGEEFTELVLASKDDKSEEIAHESADLIYHLFVLLAAHDMDLDDVRVELQSRR